MNEFAGHKGVVRLEQARPGQPMIKSFTRYLQEQNPGYDAQGLLDQRTEELRKALGTGATAISGQADGTPIRIENLDPTMTDVLIRMQHLKLFRSFPRATSIQPRFEWIRRDSFGSHRGSPGFSEGGTPTAGTSAWSRGDILNRYMGVRRGTTAPMMITGQLGGSFIDPIASENRDGTIQLLNMIERWLVWGDADVKNDAGVVVNYDGIYQQLLKAGNTSQIIDKLGEPLNFEDLNTYGEKLHSGGATDGKLLDFSQLRTFWHPKVLSDLSDLKLQAERAELGRAIPEGYRPGTPISGYQSQFGFMPLDDSILLDAVEGAAPLAVGETNAPAASATVTPTVVNDATSLLDTASYFYFVSSVNDAGESLTTASGTLAVVAGERAVLTIVRVTAATRYRVYRGMTADVSLARWIGEIAQPPSGNAVFLDRNQIRPGTSVGIILNLAEEDMVLAQMLPLTKWPLAVTSTTVEFLLILFHVLAIKAWERVIFVKNIGARPSP